MVSARECQQPTAAGCWPPEEEKDVINSLFRTSLLLKENNSLKKLYCPSNPHCFDGFFILFRTSIMVKKLRPDELNRLSADDAVSAPKKPVIIVLDNVRSALNVGSIFRTADAFGIEAVYLCGITACPPHREILKTALGATETVRWRYFDKFENAASELNSEEYQLAAVEQTDNSILLNHFIPTKKQALILGNELDGISEAALQQCKTFIEIPQFGAKYSLNVAVCAGIVTWDVIMKQGAEKK